MESCRLQLESGKGKVLRSPDMTDLITPAELISLLQNADLPPGTQILTVIVPPNGQPVDIRQGRGQGLGVDSPLYRRFVPTAQAVELMANATNAERLRSLARRAMNRQIVGFKRGYHFTDHAEPGSIRARWRFHPEHCDRFFEKEADNRIRPARRKAS